MVLVSTLLDSDLKRDMSEGTMVDQNCEDIEVTENENDAIVIREQLNHYNEQFVKPDNHQRMVLLVKKDTAVIGGLVGCTYWNWMYIELFWVRENERNRGVGSRLMEKAEEIARDRRCRNVHLETHDFQSLDFYIRRKYVVFGELDDLPEGHTKYYLRKALHE